MAKEAVVKVVLHTVLVTECVHAMTTTVSVATWDTVTKKTGKKWKKWAKEGVAADAIQEDATCKTLFVSLLGRGNSPLFKEDKIWQRRIE